MVSVIDSVMDSVVMFFPGSRSCLSRRASLLEWTVRPRSPSAARDGGGGRIRAVAVAWRLVLAIAVGMVVGAGPVWGQASSCGELAAQAERAYLQADFDDALSLLSVCRGDRSKAEVGLAVYRLEAFAHLGRGNEEAARLAVEDLLDVYPTYMPNPNDDRPDYVALVRSVRSSRDTQEEPPPPVRERRWVRWTIASLTVVAAAAVVGLIVRDGGGDDDRERPDPPDDDIDDDFD